MIKRVVLILGVAAAFLVGYASATEAWPVKGRSEYRGYFTNTYDDQGDFVWRPNTGPSQCQGTGYAIPTGINTKSEFINFVKCKLNDGSTQERRGAQFIIQTMRGSEHSAPTSSDIADWEARVRNPSLSVDWDANRSFTVNSYYQGCCGGGSDPNDDAFYSDSGSGLSIVFGTGSNAYVLRRQCANPVGNGSLGTLPPGPNFNMSGRTTINDTTVLPGQDITWRHFLRNSGPTSTSPTTIDWRVRNTISGSTTLSGNAGTFGNDQEKMVEEHTLTVPSNASPGTEFCRRIEWDPDTETGGSGVGTPACATVIADFNLTPTVTTGSSTAQQNESITFTYRVNNSGPTISTTATCKVAGQVSPPGYTPLPQQNADRNPAVSPQPSLDCDREMPIGTTTVATEVVNVGNASPGSKICRSLVVNPRDENGGFRSSAEICVVIAKSPYVHFMGNDVWAGGGFAAVNPSCISDAKIQTVARTLSGGAVVAGSATEYAAFALDRILEFGSANKALNPSGLSGWSLTFSNVNTSDLGHYGAPRHCINDYVSRYDKNPNDSGPADINVGTQPSGIVRNFSGPRSFRGDMPVGSQQIYLVEGDVTIADNIRYPANYNGIGEIPSLVVIATGNITVNRNVTQMDGIFVSRGNFFTCDVSLGTTLSVNPPCEQQLVINGAVIAGRLQLLRTFGAEGNNDNDRKRPAEVFNFNSEIYLHNALSGANGNILQTVDQRDLPPRF